MLKEVKSLIKNGVNPIRNTISNGAREIWLLGQNVNDYYSEQKTKNKKQKINFAKLLRMANDVPGDFQIRFMSPHPADFTDELIDTMAKSKKVAKYINLPVQSGDNEILKRMNRPYTIEQYKNLVKKIREKIPDINLTTDVIVGFPGETKKQFENTVKLFKEIKFNLAYIAKYSPRPGTAAFQMKDNVPLKEKKRREKILREIIEKNREQKTENRKLIVILGPTASGKSELGLKLAKKFNGEIISADSRQIYREMDIGTAKPTKKEREIIKHYLIDIKKPNQLYTVWEYKRSAIEAINQIIKKGKVPFLVGGTGLYIKAIIDNLDIPKVKPDWKLRKNLELKIKTRGLKSLYDELIKIDPEAAYIVDSQNPRRIIRAMEIAIKTNKPFSQQRKKGEPLFDVLEIGISSDKEKLKEKIEKRVDKMMKAGLLKEIKNLIKIYDKNLSTFDAIGYREIIDYLNKKIYLAEAVEKIKKNTWHFSKRQMTWFKK
ncbi:tRNA (adenosine(37)-N6)-dimethylallyltransferase MiaA, partial [Patescibacteria group bacterium]|nr:tRNA (adenosine(37)-N6)-dimethylallyltransferase MiaA [Patescibacteria group bacterium]